MQMTSKGTSLSTISTGIMKHSLKLLVTKKAHVKTSPNNIIYQTYILMDEQENQMQAVSFGTDVKRFDNILQEDHIYHVSNVIVSPMDVRYQICNNDKQIKFTRNSEVTESTEESNIKQPDVEYTSLDNLQQIPQLSNKLLNVMVVVVETKPLLTFSKSNNSIGYVQDITVVDESFKPTIISFWDEYATIEATKIGELLKDTLPIISAIRLRQTTYQGLSLSTTSMTTITINPNTSRSNVLKKWYVF
ncbi:hypothetical protein AXF42_Ash016441 [Apostasia shenzhenica]|uniref:DUF223 domain-containing protein n=1 Tax=Apostasia shenzhenica TaxID=1088818 RepID=A0A2I0A054_9ASPA|nr:hypothetical protein AXF42_Ash016441 [Apostasia shenzhenica]